MDVSVVDRNLYEDFEEYQKQNMEQNEYQLYSHDGAHYLYWTTAEASSSAQSYVVHLEEFFWKADKEQLLDFQNFVCKKYLNF